MNEQHNPPEFQESDNPDALAQGIGTRLLQVMGTHGLRQAEFARRVGASSGFVSDVVRGLKKPGADFLSRLQSVFGTSIDWLLRGDGNPNGKTGIDVDLLSSIRLQLALVRAAILDENPTAKAILMLIRNNQLMEVQADVALNQFLEELPMPQEDLDLAFAMYNSHIAIIDPLEQHRNLLAAAVAHFETQRPVNKMRSLGRAGGSTFQLNIGNSQRVAGNDYHEHK